ncbi:Putative ribonuclease H protein At1g65750, partial [Linum perenne]
EITWGVAPWHFRLIWVVASVTRAELRGIIIGLNVVWDSSHRRIACQVDSKVAIDLMSDLESLSHQHAGEVLAVHNLLWRDWVVTIFRTFREGNKAVDYLANLEHGLSHRIDTFNCNLGYFLWNDYIGISEPILIYS